MRRKTYKEVAEEIIGLSEYAGRPIKTVEEHFKKEIDELLEGVTLEKVKRARRLFDKWCADYNEVEQIYRAFCSSYKTKKSYWHFKAASIILLYLYGYIPMKDVSLLEKGKVNVEKIFEEYKEELKDIKEMDEALRDKEFWDHIPLNVSCLAVAAAISFMTAVKSILDVLQGLHEDEEYRRGHYLGGFIDWDEAILLNALPYQWCKRGGKGER